MANLADPLDVDRLWQCVDEVAWWIGYANAEIYNLSCEQNPDEVRRRLAEAT